MIDKKGKRAASGSDCKKQNENTVYQEFIFYNHAPFYNCKNVWFKPVNDSSKCRSNYILRQQSNAQ